MSNEGMDSFEIKDIHVNQGQSEEDLSGMCVIKLDQGEGYIFFNVGGAYTVKEIKDGVLGQERNASYNEMAALVVRLYKEIPDSNVPLIVERDVQDYFELMRGEVAEQEMQIISNLREVMDEAAKIRNAKAHIQRNL